MTPDTRVTFPRSADEPLPQRPPQPRPRYLAGQPGQGSRLTIGWRESDQPASLGTHLSRYGPIPRHSSGSLVSAVTEAGLTGRGGAGFPTGTKLRAVAGKAADQTGHAGPGHAGQASQRGRAVVVANGMEGEPASRKDEALLARAPHLVLDGAVLAAVAVGASTIHLCLPRTATHLLAGMRQAVAERRSASLDPAEVVIEVHGLPHRFVSSSETALVSWLNGGDAKPAAIPPRPFDKGVGRRPTLISNVETFAHIALIARFGPSWFRNAGLPDATGTMLVTLAGAVGAPGVYEIEAGTAIGTALSLGHRDKRAGAVLLGGYFGTWHRLSEIEGLPLAAAALRGAGAAPGAGVLLALPPDACGLAETSRVLTWMAGQSAGQCGPCKFGLPAIADDFAQVASGRSAGPVLARLDRRLGTVIGRGACAHPDAAVRFARSALVTFGADVRAHLSGHGCLAAAAGRRRARAPVLPVPPAEPEHWR